MFRSGAIDRFQTRARSLDVAETTLGFTTRVVLAHALVHVESHRHIEVKAQLVVDGARDTAWTEVDSKKPADAAGKHWASD